MVAKNREKLQLQYELQYMCVCIQFQNVESVLESWRTKLCPVFKTNFTIITVSRINQWIVEHCNWKVKVWLFSLYLSVACAFFSVQEISVLFVQAANYCTVDMTSWSRHKGLTSSPYRASFVPLTPKKSTLNTSISLDLLVRAVK